MQIYEAIAHTSNTQLRGRFILLLTLHRSVFALHYNFFSDLFKLMQDMYSMETLNQFMSCGTYIRGSVDRSTL